MRGDMTETSSFLDFWSSEIIVLYKAHKMFRSIPDIDRRYTCCGEGIYVLIYTNISYGSIKQMDQWTAHCDVIFVYPSILTFLHKCQQSYAKKSCKMLNTYPFITCNVINSKGGITLRK